MAVISIDGITLELPDDATPVRVLQPALIRACLEWRKAAGLSTKLEGPEPEAGDDVDPTSCSVTPEREAGLLWPEMLFHLWGCDLIEITARHGEPDAAPKPIDFPHGERVWSRFWTKWLIPYGELKHEPTGRRFFEVCIRPVSQTPPAPEAVTNRERPTPMLEEAMTARLDARGDPAGGEGLKAFRREVNRASQSNASESTIKRRLTDWREGKGYWSTQ